MTFSAAEDEDELMCSSVLMDSFYGESGWARAVAGQAPHGSGMGKALLCPTEPFRPLCRICKRLHSRADSHAPAQDFGGFRVVTLLPRYRPGWPPPGAYEHAVPRRSTAMGAPKCVSV